MLRFVAPLLIAIHGFAPLPVEFDPQTVNIDPPAPIELAERFELVAFYNEISGEEIPLVRWREGPIRVRPHGADGERYRPDIARLADELSALIGSHINLVGNSEPADMVVMIDTRQKIVGQLAVIPGLESRARFAGQAPCYTVFYSTEDSTPETIGGAIITIHRMPEEEARRCLAQEITQALGLPNDIDDPDGSVFSSSSTRSTLSESDKLLVRILYDPRLQPGMTRAEAMTIVRQIATELEAR